MAYIASIKTGVWSDPTTWGKATALGTPSNSTTGWLTSTNPGITATFTAPSTSDYAIGVVMSVPFITGFVDSTLELQEYNGATWSTVATGTVNDYQGTMYPSYLLRLDLDTNYQFTTTAANSYRWRMYNMTGGNRFRAYQGGGGTYNPYCYTIDSRSGIPGDGDHALMLGAFNRQHEVTIDAGTWTVGDYGTQNITPGVLKPTEFFECAIMQNYGCVVKFDTTGTIDFTCKGFWYMEQNRLLYGTSSVPGTNSVTLKLANDSTTLARFGIALYYNAGIEIYSTEPTMGKYYTSGNGSTGTPLTGIPSDWQVGDRIVIGGAVYTDMDRKFIKSKPSSTTAVLSDTAGGAESPLAYTHNSASYMTKTNRNFVIQSQNYTTTFGRINTVYTTYTLASLAIPTSVTKFTGVEFKNTITAFNSGRITYMSGNAYSYLQAGPFNWSGAGGVGLGEFYNTVFEADVSYTATGYMLGPTTAWTGVTMDGLVIMKYNYMGLYIQSSACTYKNVVLRGGTGNNTTSAGVLLGAASTNTFENLDYAARPAAVTYYSGGLSGNKFINCKLNGVSNSIVFNPSTYVNDYYENCRIPTPIGSMIATQPGSRIVFDTFNQTLNDNRFYTAYGSVVSTGAGLADTTVKTAGNFSRKLTPTNIEGITETFRILSPVSGISSTYFAAKRTSDFVGTVKFELFLPNTDSSANTITWTSGSVTADTWIPVSLTADTINVIPRYAEVRITAKGTAGSVYFTDIYNGSTAETGLRLFYEGRLQAITPTVVDIPGIVNAVWSDSQSYPSGTKGKTLSDTESNTDVTQAKVDQL